MKTLSLCVTSSSAWIVTLALKTCAFLARLSLVKGSLRNETAFGSTEKLHSQQLKRKTAGPYIRQPLSSQQVNYVSVRIAHTLLQLAQCLKDCFILGYYLGSRWSYRHISEKSFCLFALV